MNACFLITVVTCLGIAITPPCTAADDVPKSKVVKCSVCRSLVDEIHRAISEVDPRKTVEVGSFRITPDGEQKKSVKKYAGSETHMTELLETICNEFKDYAQARHKETNRIETIKLVVNGQMNPRFSEFEMIQDPNLNKGVQFHCESIIEDFEDEILSYFTKHPEVALEESQNKFCNDETKICVGVKDEL